MTRRRWTLGITLLIAAAAAVAVSVSLGFREAATGPAAGDAGETRSAGSPAPVAPAPGPPDAQVTFHVTVPVSTPIHAKIFIAGDAAVLGAWSAAGLQMTRDADGTYVASAALPRGKPVEFKLTRGSWQTVEKKADGGELPNRVVAAADGELITLNVEAWKDQVHSPSADAATEASSVTVSSSKKNDGIKIHPRFHSNQLDNDRTLYVCLPPGYAAERERRYPVLYMQDGQNLFDARTSFAGEWFADETAERLIDEKRIEPIIIVGIANVGEARIDEYSVSPVTSPKYHAVGRGNTYIQFVCDEVKPFIDRNYRTMPDRAHTAIGGSSMGALIAMEACRQRPDVFGACAAMSPSLWWNDRELFHKIERDSSWLKRTHLWLDVGTAEGESPADQDGHVQDVRRLEWLLYDQKLSAEKDFHVAVIDGAKHNEAAWAKRFDQVLIFLFPASTSRDTGR